MLASRQTRFSLMANLRSGSFLAPDPPQDIVVHGSGAVDSILCQDDVARSIEALQLRPRRLRAFDLERSLHCSVVGTCLDLAEIRRLVGKFTDLDVERADDHALHKAAVLLVQRTDEPGRAITRVLDRKFSAVVARFDRLDARALLAAWKDHRRRGDIAGPYWAIVTHPAAQTDLAHHVFGDVHMLSHFLGASGRADLVRLEEAERARADLEMRLATRQIRAAADAALAEQRIRALDEALERSRRAAAREPGSAPDLRRQLADADATIGRLERRIATLTARVQDLAARQNAVGLQEPLVAFADPNEGPTGDANSIRRDLPHLDGRSVLLIGGKPAQWPHLRDAITSAGGTAMHHDGGLESCLRELSAALSRADIVVTVIGCVGHGAMRMSKRFAQRTGRPWVPVRRAGMASLAAALHSVA